MPAAQSTSGGLPGKVIVLFIISFILAGISNRAIAHSGAISCGTYEQTIYSRLDFREVELISRNHKFGLYRGEPVRLSPWIQVGEGAFLGVDQAGRLMQILELGDRVVGYRLSEPMAIRDIFFLRPSQLFAIDKNGALYTFHWSEWYKSNIRGLLKRAAVNAGAGLCAVGLATAMSSEILGISLLSAPMVAQGLGLSSVVVMIQGFLFAQKFEIDNDRTNGLVPLKATVHGFKGSRYMHGSSNEIVDYVLIGSQADQSLTELVGELETIDQNFAKSCEHELLARGIPPHNYEP